MKSFSKILRCLGTVGFFITGLGPPIGIVIAYTIYHQVESTLLRLSWIPTTCLTITWILPCLIVSYGIIRDRKWGWVGGFILASIGLAVIISTGLVQGTALPAGAIAWLAFLGIVSLAGLVIRRERMGKQQNPADQASGRRSGLKTGLIVGVVVLIVALSAFGLLNKGRGSQNTPITNQSSTIVFPTQKSTITNQSSPTVLPTQNQSSPTTKTATFKAKSADAEAILTQCTQQWQACQNLSSSNAMWTGLPVGTVGATFEGDHYTLQRLLLYFDTNTIPENATITGAVLHIHVGDYLNGNTTLHVVQSTAQLSPSEADFSRIGEQSGGSIKPANANVWLEITLNDSSLGWITPAGTTRLALRNDLDLRNINPASTNDVVISLYESAQYAPYLDVTYTIP